MTQSDDSLNFVSKAFLENAYKQLNEFKNLSCDDIRILMKGFFKTEKAFKCSLFIGNNQAFEGLIELYDEAIRKIPNYELQTTNITQLRDIMVLVGRGLEDKKCVATSLLSDDEKFLAPSVIAQVKAIKICQSKNSKNPFVVNEDKIIDNFNQTLNNISFIYPPDYSDPAPSIPLNKQDGIDQNIIELIGI
ncbi:MAG TPA: hypothetical protein LFW21_03575 [Rickettsia endosymbiont of Pyrocoelia pectoralis]|nr:hypothetical protein [Rickettsia endosymbiont of Pyrocoelia pectoralis]